MSWGSLALALVQLALTLVAWAKEKQTLAAGQDKAIAAAALQLLEVTEEGRQLRARVMAMTDPEAEALWRRMTGAN